MKNVTLIAAIGKNNELGKNNNLIWRIKEDLNFFRENTIGKPVVMGFNTLKSLPKRLKGRDYIILTSKNIECENNDIVVHSLDELLEVISKIDKEVMVIGGASLYSQMIDYADKMLLTEIDDEDTKADCFFPSFSKEVWDREVLSSNISEDKIKYKHLVYKRK